MVLCPDVKTRYIVESKVEIQLLVPLASLAVTADEVYSFGIEK